MAFKLAGGAASYSESEAREWVFAYAFENETIKPDADFPDAFAPHDIPRYAYRTYDCVAASDGAAFSDLDLFVTAGLNAGVDVGVVARLRSFADRAAASLDRAHQLEPDFLRLTREEIGYHPSGSAGWHLAEAWRQGKATHDLDIARVHKTLHQRSVPCCSRYSTTRQ